MAGTAVDSDGGSLTIGTAMDPRFSVAFNGQLLVTQANAASAVSGLFAFPVDAVGAGTAYCARGSYDSVDRVYERTQIDEFSELPDCSTLTTYETLTGCVYYRLL